MRTTVALDTREKAVSATTTDLSRDGVAEISGELRHLLADMFALYFENEEFPLAHERASIP
jgi:hypothetical protein